LFGIMRYRMRSTCRSNADGRVGVAGSLSISGRGRGNGMASRAAIRRLGRLRGIGTRWAGSPASVVALMAASRALMVSAGAALAAGGCVAAGSSGQRISARVAKLTEADGGAGRDDCALSDAASAVVVAVVSAARGGAGA